MQIQHESDGQKGHFIIKEKDGSLSAEMTYVHAGPGLIIIDHTEVDEIHKGKSVGAQLVYHAVEFARANQLSILPLCPFAKSVFDKTPEYNDVRKQ